MYMYIYTHTQRESIEMDNCLTYKVPSASHLLVLVQVSDGCVHIHVVVDKSTVCLVLL